MEPQSTHIPVPSLKKGEEPLTRQLAAHLREVISGGGLSAGDRLPPSRDLARDWGVARGTLVEAIEILCSEELLVSRRGAGVFVSNCRGQRLGTGFAVTDHIIASPRAVPVPRIEPVRKMRVDFRPCRPSVERFPYAAWRRHVSKASLRAPSADVADAQGDGGLRAQIAAYLRRSRSLMASPDKVFISMGIVHAVQLLSRLYLKPGSRVVMEDPGYPLVRQIFELAGAEIISCPVDEVGLIVEALPHNGKDVAFVYVTPSHQFPMGGRLSSARRATLIDWAMEHGVIILEDDYDGEFRYDVPPLPPLAAMPNACVIYLGTFSKTLFPDLRVGYVVAPRPVIEALRDYRAIHEYGAGTTLQYALSGFLETGEFERHVARMSKLYRSKCVSLEQALREADLPGILAGLQSGLHSVLLLDVDRNAKDMSSRAEEAGLLVPPISQYAYSSPNTPNGLVVGYAASTLPQIQEGVSILQEICKTQEG